MPLDALDRGLDEFGGLYLFFLDQLGKPEAIEVRIFGKPYASLPRRLES